MVGRLPKQIVTHPKYKTRLDAYRLMISDDRNRAIFDLLTERVSSKTVSQEVCDMHAQLTWSLANDHGRGPNELIASQKL